MADDELATKAPESDAQQPSVVSAADTPAQQGPSMGDHCVTDRPSREPPPHPEAHMSSQATQRLVVKSRVESVLQVEISKIADIDVYIAKPSDYPHLPSKLLLLLSSGSGIHSKNNQLQADKYAGEGFLVVMPDQFAGDPAPNIGDHDTAEEETTVIEKVKMGIATTVKSFGLDMWLARQTPEKVLPILHKVLDGAKEEFADAVANGGGIYAVGYCFGGKYVCLLASELPDTVAKGQAIKDEEKGMVKTGPFIKCGTFAHGTSITKEDLEGLKAPVSIVAVEEDQLFPDEVRNAGKEHLDKENIEYEMEIYPGVPHGFAVVGEYGDSKIQDAQKRAFEQMLGWLKAH